MYIIKQLKRNFSLMLSMKIAAENFTPIPDSGPIVEKFETSDKKNDNTKSLYFMSEGERFLLQQNVNQQTDVASNSVDHIKKVMENPNPYGIIDHAYENGTTMYKVKGIEESFATIKDARAAVLAQKKAAGAKKVDVKDLFKDVGTEGKDVQDKATKSKKIGQFDGIEIDGKPLDVETYKKITAKQFNELSRDKSFQLMQGGEDKVSADSVESGDTVKIQFPTEDSYLHVSAASFPENIRSIVIDGTTYKRKGKNGEFFELKEDGTFGKRAVIGDKDPTKSQEIKIGEVLRGDKFEKMLKEYDTKTAEALKKMDLKEGTDKYEIMKKSLERGLSKDEVELWLNKDAAGIKKLSKDKQTMLVKNFMYLGQEGLTGKKDKALQINDAYAKKSVDKNGKTIYTFAKVDGKKTTEEMIKGAESFTVKRIDKEGTKKEKEFKIGKNEKGKFIYKSGKEKGKPYIAKEADVIIPEEKEKEKDKAKKADTPNTAPNKK